jgi:hypothetical protein
VYSTLFSLSAVVGIVTKKGFQTQPTSFHTIEFVGHKTNEGKESSLVTTTTKARPTKERYKLYLPNTIQLITRNSSH